MIPVSIVIAGIIIAIAIMYTPGKSPTLPTGDQEVVDNYAPPQEAQVDDDTILGEVDAPVTIIVFGDYECPFCERMYQDAEQQIRDEYVATGKARIVYRDFPLSFHPAAMPAALAAECAGDQGKYWNYHDALFDRQAEIESMDYVALADELELDVDVFTQCFETEKYADEVAKDFQDGANAGVEGTPATFINGKLVSGAQPYSVFKQVIEAELAN